MYPFTETVPTTKKSKGTNKDLFIVIHHTAGGTFASNVQHLSGNLVPGDPNPVSTHFVIGPNEEAAKIGDPADIQWHAGDSSRGTYQGMNNYAMGIEVVGYGEYNTHQLIRLTDLVEYLMGVFNIPKENVLRHSDITQVQQSLRDHKTLRDGKTEARKIDIANTFFPQTFATWQSQLSPRRSSRYVS